MTKCTSPIFSQPYLSVIFATVSQCDSPFWSGQKTNLIGQQEKISRKAQTLAVKNEI